MLLCGFDWPGHVERLLLRLERPSSEPARRDVLRLLGEVDSPVARAALARATSDPSPALRAEALWALAKAHDDTHADAVRAALKDVDASVRAAAIEAVGTMRLSDGVALLTRSLSDSEPAVRSQGARVLGLLGDRAAVPALSSALDDASTEVRVAAARALASIGDERALDPLLSKARDGAPELREAVVEALAHFAGDRAAPVLVQALTDASDVVVLAALRAIDVDNVGPWLSHVRELAESPRPRVRNAAEGWLLRHSVREEKARAPSHEPAWLALLEQTVESTPENTPRLLSELERVLPEREPLAAGPLLEWLGRARPEFAPRIVRLLGRTGAPAAVQPLAQMLDGATRELELAVLDALGQLGSQESQAALLARLEREDSAVRERAAPALMRTASTREVPALQKLLRSDQGSVRRAAMRVLATVLERETRPLDESVADPLVRDLLQVVERGDEREYALASRCLGLLRSERALAALGTGAGLHNPRRRITAIAASATMTSQAARSLRQVDAAAPSDLRAVALSAAALAGDTLDAATLAKLASGSRWPLGPAAAFGLAQLSQEPRTAKLGPLLCPLLHSHDPWTRANVLAGLARMPGLPCADQAGPLWLRHARAESVRLAAAHWARARVSASRQASIAAALSACARDDGSALVRAACAGETAPPAEASICGGVCGLLLAGGFVLVSFPDAAGDPSWPRVRNMGVELPSHAPYGRE
jgi:HEAT repeat protein